MTQPTTGDSRERQQQIAADLRALILAGELMPGDRLPSTAALMAQFGVHDKTVQGALRILKDERFIEGRRGAGVFVTAQQPLVIRASHYPQPAGEGQPYSWISDHASRNREASIDLIEVGVVPAPAQVAKAFGIEKGSPVMCRHQLLKLDGEPAELVWHYYPEAVALGTALAGKRKIKGGTPALLSSLGFPPRNAVDQVGTRLATVEEFTALKLPQTMPVLRQFRVVFTDHRQVIEVTVMIKAGQAYEVQYELPER